MTKNAHTNEQLPTIFAVFSIVGGLCVGLIMVFVVLNVMYGVDATFAMLAGQQRVQGITYRIGTLVMVVGTGVGMVLVMLGAEKIWRIRRKQ